MPSFAELRDKAGKAKDASVTKFQDTKDRHSSVPLKNTNWNPYDKNAAPPPPQAPPRINSQSRPPPVKPPLPPPPRRAGAPVSPAPVPSPSASPSPGPGPPPIIRSTRPSMPSTGPLPPPPSRTAAAARFPVRQPEPEPEPERQRPTPPVRKAYVPAEPQLDWTNLSQEDKEVFFAWLDEFFSRHLGRPVHVSS
ncbi:hypothetical protein FB45DRAFT_930886 [Roridomyces roridus]|uniref:Proline-rich protein n=1 Tax=Roridomyces roridus TaxID=1738132 RepID=A0AAD7BFJ7_9AGAR|nr:hypothetical protein FB45DRAFT_930886 [Roridomyces roridus]